MLLKLLSTRTPGSSFRLAPSRTTPSDKRGTQAREPQVSDPGHYLKELCKGLLHSTLKLLLHYNVVFYYNLLWSTILTIRFCSVLCCAIICYIIVIIVSIIHLSGS